MDIKRSGSQPSAKGPAEYFTGNVRLDPLFHAPDPARVTGASVTLPTTAMTHIAIQERDADGTVVNWMERVTDEQYRVGPKVF
jgi:hypothetical protein